MLKLKLQYFGHLMLHHLVRKDLDAGKGWRQEEKDTEEDEIVEWHHRFNGYEFEQALGDGDGQGSQACCSPWGHKESDNNNNKTLSRAQLLKEQYSPVTQHKLIRIKWVQDGRQVNLSWSSISKVYDTPRSTMTVSVSESQSVVSDSLWSHGLYNPWNSPGQNTGMGSLSLLQGIFPTQGLNPGLPYYRQILYQLSHKGSPW